MERSIEDYPVTSCVKRIVLCSGGTAFLDGFNMIVASVALTLMGDAMSPAEAGMYASAYLVGVFIASFVGGKLGDIVGRTVIYKAAPLLITVVSIALLFINVPAAVICGRFLVGICIGADYPMVSAIVAEYSPDSYRSKGMVILMMAWYVGALAGSVVGFAMYGVGENWAWLLFTPAVPAILFFLGRMSVPESYRWLAGKGRMADADKALKKVFGPEASIDDLKSATEEEQAEPKKGSLLAALKAGYLKRYIFVAGFWTFQVIPVTAVFMFGPTIMQMFGLGEGSLSVLGTALIYVFILIGVLPAMKTANTMSRRKTLIVTYVIMSIALALLGVFANAGALVILVLFLAYSVAYGLQSVLDNIYPPELFPTEVRATAVGTTMSISKVGGAVASFLFPIGLAGFGLSTVVLIGAGLSVCGLVISIALAPETKGMSLEESSTL